MSVSSKKQSGFTLVELIVCIIIFVMMTALLVAKYSNFNNSVLFTNLAYDIALTIRTAQTYGLSVQGQQNAPSGQSPFQIPYGIAVCAFNDLIGCLATNDSNGNATHFTNKQIVMFADVDKDGAYDNNDYPIQTYNITQGAYVSCIAWNNGSSGFTCNTQPNGKITARADITFVRPNPDAIICWTTDPYTDSNGDDHPFAENTPAHACYGKGGAIGPQPSMEIVIKAPDGSTRNILIRQDGEVSVAN